MKRTRWIEGLVNRQNPNLILRMALILILVAAVKLDPMTHVGPMAFEAHRTRVGHYIGIGKREARLVTGGGRPASRKRGWFISPTQAVRIANDSPYELGGTVWSTDANEPPKSPDESQAAPSASTHICQTLMRRWRHQVERTWARDGTGSARELSAVQINLFDGLKDTGVNDE